MPRCVVPILQLPEPPLSRAVDQRVPGHDQVRIAREAHEVGRDAARLEVVQLLDHHLRIDDAAGADHALLAADDPRRDVLELVRLAVGDDGVAGVRAAVVAAHEVGVLRQQIDDLPLPFVAPLRADDHGRGHVLECALRRGYAAVRPTRRTEMRWPRGQRVKPTSASARRWPATFAAR